MVVADGLSTRGGPGISGFDNADWKAVDLNGGHAVLVGVGWVATDEAEDLKQGGRGCNLGLGCLTPRHWGGWDAMAITCLWAGLTGWKKLHDGGGGR